MGQAATGTKKATHFLDHILAPIKATVNGYTLVGIEHATGRLTQPRASDHLLVALVVSSEFQKRHIRIISEHSSPSHRDPVAGR
jgi:hypothetical protein